MAPRTMIAVAAVGFAGSSAMSLRGAQEPSIDALKTSVMGSSVFMDKVETACRKQNRDNEDCRAEAAPKLFCELMKRSKPELASQACAPAVTTLVQKNTTIPDGAETLIRGMQTVMDNQKKVINKAAKVLAVVCATVKPLNTTIADGAETLINGMKTVMDKQAAHQAATVAAKAAKEAVSKPAAKEVVEGKKSFMELGDSIEATKAPEDELAKEMTHDLEMNFNKIAPFGKEDTAKELQDHAAKTQDTLVDAVENAEVAEIKRAVFRALTRLRAATIKEFDTIARLETQAIDAYNDAHHYRAENPLAHLHEDEAPVETDKLKSFH